MDRLLRIGEVQKLIGASRTGFYQIRRAGGFPAPVLIAKNARRWRASDVSKWIASRPTAEN